MTSLSTVLLVLVAVGAVVRASAAAPASVAGMIYFDDTVTFVRTDASEGRVLSPDGTFRGIFRVGTYGTLSVGNPSDGRWDYRKTGPATAELSLGPFDVRTLTFESEEEGTLRGTGAVQRLGTFKLVHAAKRAPLVNCSNRSFVRAGGVAFSGFVVTERKSYVLVRAVGPGLSSFGVSPALAGPILEVYSGETLIAQNAGWSTGAGAESIRRTGQLVGAFSLTPSSADAAVIIPLPAGAYTAKVRSADGSQNGEVLTEVYLIQ